MFVDTNEGTPRDVWTMEEYMANCGVQRAEGFQIYDSSEETGASAPELDFAVYTSADLPAESPVLSIPAEMILSSKTVRDTELKGIVEAAEASLQILGVKTDQFGMFHLFLKILMEYEKGDESPWFPWLNSLPRKYSNGASMTPFCFECLPPLVASLASEERVRFIHFFNSLNQVRFLSEQTKNDKDLARWAYNVVYTRAFGNNNEPGKDDSNKRIVPMADLFNHATDTEIDIRFDEEGNCFAITSRDVPANSPLRMSYGCSTNPSHLFARYGFLDESSPATFCKIMNIESTKELRDVGLDFARMLFYKDTGDITEEVWDVILYTILDEEDPLQEDGYNREIQRAFHTAHMKGDLETKNAIHQQFFPKTCRYLQIHVNSFINELDELLTKSATMDVNEHPRIPIIMQHNAYVKETFMRVKNNLDAMAPSMIL